MRTCDGLRALLRAVPRLGGWFQRLPSAEAHSADAVADYWEARYARGGASGAGSLGEVAHFKARFLNDLIRRRGLQSVVEFGCGDGSQLGLAEYPAYLGLDVAPSAIAHCRARFGSDPGKRFAVYAPATFDPNAASVQAEAALSLDVLYHLVDDATYERHLEHLFGAATRCVVIFSSDSDRRSAPHVRHRHFTPLVATRFPHWRLTERVVNPHRRRAGWPLRRGGSFADFFVYELSAEASNPKA